jgi:hypothetical protein
MSIRSSITGETGNTMPDIAASPRKPAWKIDYYENASRAFGAENAFEITDCYRVLSNKISVSPRDSGGPVVRWSLRDRAQLRETKSIYRRKTAIPSKSLGVRRMRAPPVLVPENHTLEAQLR